MCVYVYLCVCVCAQWLSGTKKDKKKKLSQWLIKFFDFVCVSDCFYLTKLKIKNSLCYRIIQCFVYGFVRLCVCLCVSVCV